MLLQGTSPFWLTEKLSREESDGMGFQLSSSFPLPSAFCEPTEFWVLFMVLNYIISTIAGKSSTVEIPSTTV